jgi:hypothetical protein
MSRKFQPSRNATVTAQFERPADAKLETPFQQVKAGQAREALDRLERLVIEGLKHGFFDYSIGCQVANGGKRQLVIRAGMSHKFTIPEDELSR